MRQNECYKGTELKYLVNIQSPGFSMDDDNFEIVVKRGVVSRVFKKEDLSHRDDSYYLCFDSEEFGVGDAVAVAKAFVPDEDFADGFRTEVYKVQLVRILDI